MTGTAIDTAAILWRAGILGVFGGTALVLTHVYSRRGPMLYPVYAAILATAALMLSQFSPIDFRTRFVALLLVVTIATGMSLIRVLVVGARQRRQLDVGPVVPGGAPWWGMPLVVMCLVAASAGTALMLR